MRLLWACSLVLLAATGWLMAAQNPPNADTHKAWMDDAGDLQEDLREALPAKDGAKVSEAAVKIEQLMAQTEKYWAAKGAADIVKVAQDSQALCRQVSAAAKASAFDEAQASFAKLSANCNACHDLHPEKR